MDFRGQPEILNTEDYGLSGTEPVINQECMLVHEKSGHYVKLSGTAIIDNITASNSLFEAVFSYNRKLHFLLYKSLRRMRTRANKNYVASVSVFTSVVARQRHWRSATRSARECAKAHSLFYPDKSLRTFSLLTSGQSAGDMQTADRKNLNKEKETKL